MLKHLPVFIIVILFFTTANAQSNADTAKHSPVDTVVKHIPADSIAKHLPADTTIKHTPADSVVKHVRDTSIKHAAVDSVAKIPSPDSVKKHPPHTPGVKHPPVTVVVKQSPIKTISDKQYNAYLNGTDMDDMALPAELNHYPTPDKALKFKKELSLSPIQVGNINKIAVELHRKKVEMGAFIIRNEKMLDSLFHNKQMDEGEIIFYSNRTGLYVGELRNAILQACFSTEKILSDDQIRKLEALEKSLKVD